MVEQGLLRRFDESEIQRVLTSWRLLDKDYKHRVYVGEPSREGSSNMIQECHSYLPNLTVRPWWDPQDFAWTKTLELKYKEILKEFNDVMSDMDRLQQMGNNIWAGALTQDAASYGEGWKTLGLMDRGWWDPVNVNLFPKTAKAIHDCGVPVSEVFFASMKGPSSIKLHTDFTNFVLTSHLPLIIPCNGQNKCRLTIGDETREWINGKIMVFDTSLLHDAVNESNEMRYILMMRIWHPELTLVERQALQFTFDCLGIPELTSSDPDERQRGEQMAERMHTFPLVKQKAQGFGGTNQKTKSSKKK